MLRFICFLILSCLTVNAAAIDVVKENVAIVDVYKESAKALDPFNFKAASIDENKAVDGAKKENVWLLVDTNSLKIEVKRGEQTIDIIEGIAIGQAGAGQKVHRGDNITPFGEYRIGWVGERSTFHRFFGLNYPSTQDAAYALRKGVIDKYTYGDIVNAHSYGHVPPQNTPLGGRVGIHGLGSASLKIHQSMNWTHGCIAMTDKQIDHLSQWINTGTLVKIK